jgi:hypothetical protein
MLRVPYAWNGYYGLFPGLQTSPCDCLACAMQALEDYTYVAQVHEDLALASYARTGRALMLYQVCSEHSTCDTVVPVV